ncbi:MAG: bifunctional diaminohydroxyphosphoribosylaminopyrimidine deaminase/5-amino-6-(5-phosphoribosylamino)uracil reductase RibD [Candidatus Micrarchaeota archaeon]
MREGTFMRQAFRLAKKANPYPNPRVGAVLVKNGKVIGEGFHRAPGKPHAEIEAIEDAKRRAGTPHAARGATLYVTLEPCSHSAKRTPPCTKAIIREGISKVVYAMKDMNPLVSGAKELSRAGIKVVGPTGGNAAKALNRDYIALIGKKPFAAIKMAMSADGKTATRSGDSKWISCPKSRAYVHWLRTEYGAVMVGAGTIETDNPELTAHGKGRDPYRIIIDRRLSIEPRTKVLRNKDGKTIVVTVEKADQAKALAIQRAGARVLVCGRDAVDLGMLMTALNAMGIRKILIEGGSELNADAIEAGIVDMLYLFIAPKIVGGRESKGVFGGIGISSIGDAIKLDKMKIRKIGVDFLLEADIIRKR